MNAETVAKIMNMNPQNTQKLSAAWEQAQQLSRGITNKDDAMKLLAQQGIDNGFLTKVGGYLNHPLAGMVANMAGINLNQIKQDLGSLQGSPSQGTPAGFAQPTLPQLTPGPQPFANANTQGDPLAALRAGLQQLKR